MEQREIEAYLNHLTTKRSVSASTQSGGFIVMPANDVMKPLHERMPAIIAPSHFDLWLDPRVTDKTEIMSYLSSAPSGQLVIYPISPWVNAPKHDDDRCMKSAGDM